jgi:hypothetical protein
MMRTYSDGLGTPLSISARPTINSNHIDGPLLTFRDGQMHWLTLWERLLLRLGLTNAEILERQRRPYLMRVIERARHHPSLDPL